MKNSKRSPPLPEGGDPKGRGVSAKRPSLASQSRLWLTAFSAFILLILWILQFALFTPFYHSLRRNEIRRAGRDIVRAYESGDDFGLLLRQYAFNQNLRIMLIDSSGWILGNFDGFGTMFTVGGGRIDITPAEFAQINSHFADSTARELTYINREGARAVYIARAAPSPSGERFLYVGSPIPPNDATVRVLSTQYLLITVILLLLSAAGAWLVSRGISGPILRLTASAKGLARGEFKPETRPRDYAEIALLNEELTRATEELTKAERYRRELLANVSHDLKTPLTIIKFYGEMLRDISGDDPARREAHCAKIIGESDRLADMVNELLEVSKLEQTAEIAMAPLRLDTLLRETAERFTPLQEREGYTFTLSIQENVRVPGNADLLGRAVYNLIANAAEHAGEGKRVWLRLYVVENFARVEVSDAGAGIPPEELEHIWERYYKSGQAHRRGAGSGLGLSIVRTALRLHGARYGVVSAVGQGSTFWFEMELC